MMPFNKQRHDDLLPDARPAGGRRFLLPCGVALAVLLVFAGGYYAYRYLGFARQPKPVVISDTIELKLYYPMPPSKLGMKGISAMANSTDREKVDIILSALKQNKVLPDGVSLTEFAADPDGTLLLNFSYEITALKLDPVTEIQTVYAVVNSFLANFNKAKNVQLLAGGQPFFTINGTVYTYKPIEFNSQILED